MWTVIMNWKNIREFYIIMLIINVVQGVKLMTKFARIVGDGDADLTCARTANDREYLAAMIDVSKICTNLDWNWGIAPSYETGATYYDKKHVVEIYETPLVLQGGVPIKLPIRFFAGSSINMHITFTADDFAYGVVQLVDTLDEVFNIYSGPSETIMILMELKAQTDHIYFKTWQGWWSNRGGVSPYPFPAGSTHKLTFKALTTEMQILIDDVEVMKYIHCVPPEDARMLQFTDSGMLLEKIEFIAN